MILAALVVMIAMVALVTVFPSSAAANKRGENRLVADAMGQSVLEESRAQDFRSLSLGTTDLGNVTSANTTFERSREVFAVSGTDPQHVKGVRVLVRWHELNSDQVWTQETWLCSVEK